MLRSREPTAAGEDSEMGKSWMMAACPGAGGRWRAQVARHRASIGGCAALKGALSNGARAPARATAACSGGPAHRPRGAADPRARAACAVHGAVVAASTRPERTGNLWVILVGCDLPNGLLAAQRR
mmetsp:Transcript_4266/g.11053  ORF Transcript_4266/g.11053 Transcript_4266/m.11053 type:complete len:126 (-) Transcript_4266:221-598(-)